MSAGTIDGGDPPRAHKVVRRRYGSCPPRRQGSAPVPCRRQIGCSLKTAGRVLLRIYSPGPDRSAFSVLAADTHEVDDFYIGAMAPGKSGRGTKQQPMLAAAGRAAAPCAAQKGCSKDCWRQVGHDQLCHTSKIRADGWSGKACRPLFVLRARLKGVRQSGRGCIPSHGPQGDIHLQGLR